LISIDFYLENEIKKATSMLYTFKHTLGEDRIPRELLDIAKGVVFFTIIKVGFMFTGRYGTGLVVAKLSNGTWSAPSAVQMSGIGWGLQIGAELTDVLLILSTDSAVNAFKSRAQISVGAELGVSVGPIGRSIESDVTAGNKGAAHAFSYAQSKGLFVGASLGTVMALFTVNISLNTTNILIQEFEIVSLQCSYFLYELQYIYERKKLIFF